MAKREAIRTNPSLSTSFEIGNSIKQFGNTNFCLSLILLRVLNWGEAVCCIDPEQPGPALKEAMSIGEFDGNHTWLHGYL